MKSLYRTTEQYTRGQEHGCVRLQKTTESLATDLITALDGGFSIHSPGSDGIRYSRVVRESRTNGGNTDDRVPNGDRESIRANHTARREVPASAIFPTVRAKHEAEFKASAIHPDLWENFKTLETNEEILNFLLVGSLERTNTGRVSRRYLDAYDGLNSGWVVETEGSDFVQFKPDEPRTYTDEKSGKEKAIKYESPPKFSTDIILLKHVPNWITDGKDTPVYWEWVKTSECPEVYIAEGAKKTASLLSQGLHSVAVPGIWNTHTCKGGEVIPQLLQIVKNKKVVHLCYDAPDKLTQHADLEEAYRRLKNIILDINPCCEVRIVCWEWWKGKGIDDVLFGSNKMPESLPYYEGLRFLNTNIPAFKRITGNRYLDLESVDNFENKYTGLIAGKDAGKSTTIGKYLKTLDTSDKVLAITHRIKLGLELARNLGLYYLNGKFNTSPEFKYKLILCINSLSVENVNPDDWKDATIVLDEVVQLCNAIYSGTLKKAGELLRNLQAVLMSAKKIILADADLDYKTLKLLNEIMPGCDFLKNLKIYEMEKKVDKIPMQVHKVSNRKAGAAVYERALSSLIAGKKILVMVDSQRPTSKLSAENIKRSLEKGYKEATGRNIRGLALYAKSTKNKGHEASQIIDGIDVVYQYDFVVYTTVIGTGVSLDKDKLEENPYFDEVIGGFSGAISVDDILQGLHRYRRGVPRIVFLPNKGIAAAHAGSYVSKRLNKLNTWKVKQEILGIYAAITPEIPDTGEINRPLEDYDCALRAFLKYECDNFFESFCQRATKDYSLVVDGVSKNLEVPTILEETVKEVFNEYVETTISAKVIESEEVYEELKAKPVILQHEAENLEKTQLAKKYRIESHEALICQELIELDSEMGYASGIKNHYHMDKIFYAEAKGESNIKSELLDFEKFKKDPLFKTKLLLELGAGQLRETAGEKIDRTHPIVLGILENYRKIETISSGVIWRHLHIRLNEKDPMKLIDSLALKQAMTRKSEGRVRVNGEKISQVSYTIADTMRFKIFKVWDENNELDMINSQLWELREAESKLLERLRSADTSEPEKVELRVELSKSGTIQDALKEQSEGIQTVRNQRKEEYKAIAQYNILSKVEARKKATIENEFKEKVEQYASTNKVEVDVARAVIERDDALMKAF